MWLPTYVLADYSTTHIESNEFFQNSFAIFCHFWPFLANFGHFCHFWPFLAIFWYTYFVFQEEVKMPGNVKLGFSNEPDPDPTPYLYVSADIKRMDSHKPYDPKKSVWIPEENGGFVEGNP